MHLSITTKKGFIMTSRIWTKKQTQATIKSLRAAGYTVLKSDSGYTCEIDGLQVFCAMIGSHGYLVRYNAELFS